MVLDFIKLLLDEPSKLKKLIIVLSRIALSVVFAGWLYIKILSKFTVFDILDFRQWSEFIFSGRVLVVGFIYLISYFILFYILEGLLAPLVIWFLKPSPVKRIDKIEGKIIGWVLRKGKLLDIDGEAKKIRLMENSDSLYEIATAFSKKETKDEMKSFQHSLINEIFFTYAAFVLLYFGILHDLPHTKGLTALLLICLVIFLLAYGGIGTLLELIYKISPDLVRMVNNAKHQEFFEKCFKDNRFSLYEPENKYDQHKVFYWDGAEIAVLLATEVRRIKKYMAESEVSYANENNKTIWLFTNRPIHDEAQQVFNQNSEKVLLITFDSQEELAEKVKEKLAALCHQLNE